jgi:hypothetical protein
MFFSNTKIGVSFLPFFDFRQMGMLRALLCCKRAEASKPGNYMPRLFLSPAKAAMYAVADMEQCSHAYKFNKYTCNAW